jgi:DNA-directed RNA polymerase subunit alpha
MAEIATVVEERAVQRELSLADILEIEKAVRRSTAERDRLVSLDGEFEKAVAPRIPRDEEGFRRAVFAWALGRTDEAETAFSRRKQNPIALFLLGCIAEGRGLNEEAADLYKDAARQLRKEPRPLLAHANALRKMGEPEKAGAALDRVEKSFGESAESLFQRGYLREAAGDTEDALNLYQRALSTDAGHADAAFRAGYILDLRGNDDEAMRYYRRCASGGSVYAGAMMNLALLYEDRGENERAIACYRDVLRAEPTNRKARLFLQGAIESTEEVYDELERKEQEKLDQVLRTPVSEFELSVRSRNCLARMNIKTLGDLVQKTESEMLAYKNFGETSLREIKQLLANRGLRLGMGREEVERRHKRERLALVMSDSDSRLLSTPISELNLSVRSSRCMARLNIKTVGDLITRTSDELLAMKNFGQTSLNEIRSRLAEMGLGLRSATAEAS